MSVKLLVIVILVFNRYPSAYGFMHQNKNFTLFIMGFTILEIKTPVPPNAGNEIQSCVGMLNLGSKFIYKKKKEKNVGSFSFKVTNSTIYSIQREVIKEVLIFKVSNLVFAFWFHEHFSSFFSFDISFSQMAAKRTFGPYNQLIFL